MSIKAKVEEVRTAYGALRHMNDEIRLPQAAAWRVARLMGKLKPIVADYEEAQLKLFKDVGGIASQQGINIPPLERGEDESAKDWKKRQDERRADIDALNEAMRELNKNEVEVDYDPLPLNLFEDKEDTPEDKKKKFSANDFADLGPFITE